MPLVTHTFSKIRDMSLFLRGGIKAGPLPSTQLGGASPAGRRVTGLDGLTLVFVQPAAVTVTFSDASGQGLTFAQVISEIETAIAAVQARFIDNCLQLEEATPSAGVSINLATSTAAGKFGWRADGGAGTATNVPYNPPDGAAPRFIDFSTTPTADGYALIVEV